MQGRAAEDHAVVLDHRVAGDVALDLGAVALDQRAVALEGFDQLDDAAHVVNRGLAQLLEFFIDDHGAYAVVHIDFQQQCAVGGKRQDMAAFHAMLAGAHAVLQVKAHIGRLLRRGELGQQAARGVQRQLGVDGVVFVGCARGVHANAGHLGQEQQLVGLQFNGHAGRHFFHAEIEGFARGREAEGRDQHHGFGVQCTANAFHVDLAHQTRVHEVHAVDNAHGAGREEVARDYAHARTGHGCVGQALAEGGFDLVTQLAGRFLGAIESDGVGHAHAVVVARLLALEAQLLVDLGAETVHQHDLHAHGLDHGQILHDGAELAGIDGFTGQAHHKGLVSELVDIGGHGPEPGDKGEVENGGHDGARRPRKAVKKPALQFSWSRRPAAQSVAATCVSRPLAARICVRRSRSLWCRRCSALKKIAHCAHCRLV